MGPATCKYCSRALSPLRSLTDGEFCCDEHRHVYQKEHAVLEGPKPAQNLLPLGLAASPAGAPEVSIVAFTEEPESAGSPELPHNELSGASHVLDAVQSLFRLSLRAKPAGASRVARVACFPASPGPAVRPQLPQAKLNPVAMQFDPPLAADPESRLASAAVESEPEPTPEISVDIPPEPRFHQLLRSVAASWGWIQTAWGHAPMELKAMTFLLPVLLAVAGVPLMPRVQVPQAVAARQMMARHWKGFAQIISNRAAIAFNDDFRSGLDNWESHSNLTSTWSYDSAGFVQPGPLAIYKPTLELTDYRFEFLGEIDRKALGFAFRAQDLDNYWALKLNQVKSGPLPTVELVRYAVINGKEGPKTQKQLPLTVRADTMYRVAVEARGNDFIVTVQDETVDSWTDARLKKGGVGFFCGRGEKARLRWVSVSHQYDTLGRLCAFLVPYGLGGLNGP